jgi:hypothetical protein
MKSKLTVVATFLVATACYRGCLAATLTFDSPIADTIADQDGLGSGFIQRLPGTGSALPSSDPNMSLSTNPGRLTLQSTHADINQSYLPTGVNLGQLEAPGFFVPGVGAQDITVSALFRDVQVPNNSDQLFLYLGTSQNSVVRVGLHSGNRYAFVVNQGVVDTLPFISDFGAFASGDDVQLTFGRSGGQWQMTWQNLTTPAESGSSPFVSLPWLDAQSDLYVGVLASNAGTDISFAAQIDTFSFVVVPEPSSRALLVAGFVLLGLAVQRTASA